MKSKLSLIISAVFIVGFSIFIFNKYRTLDYKELLDDHLNDDASVISMTIRTRSDIQGKEFTATIEDQQIINRILKKPIMTLKKVFNPDLPSFKGNYENTLSIKTNKESFHFYFDESHIFIDKKEYKIENRPILSLLDVIKSEDLEWIENN